MNLRVATAFAAIAAALAPSAWAQHLTPRDVDALPASPPTLVERYGADPLQVGELRVPPGKGPFPVVVVIHGGCWTKGFAQMRNTSALSDALTRDGIATWNIDYRQLGDPGAGWPGTFQDWAAGTDHVRELASRYPLDLKRVIVIGHSAGAHAALWVAARGRLPASSPIRGADPLPVRGTVAIDGPFDLAPFVGEDAQVCGKPVIAPLLGGLPAAVPDHYREASPAQLLPTHVPAHLVTGALLTPDLAARYKAAAEAKGDTADVLAPAGADHFNIIAPNTAQGAQVKAFIEAAIPSS